MNRARHIALAGKGGTGKTTTSALMIRYLVENKKGSILAVDADYNSNLNEALGVEVTNTIANLLLDVKKNNVPKGMSKQTFLELRLHQSMVETDDFDLLVMGGPQGPGCYCFPTEILKKNIDILDNNYDYMVIDNEAGLEHISRKTIEDIDIMLLISDATAKGVRTVGKIYELAKSLKIGIGEAYIIITKTDDPTELLKEVEATGLNLLGVIPNDPLIAEYDLEGKPLLQLPEESRALQAAREMFSKLNL